MIGSDTRKERPSRPLSRKSRMVAVLGRGVGVPSFESVIVGQDVHANELVPVFLAGGIGIESWNRDGWSLSKERNRLDQPSGTVSVPSMV